MEPTWSAAETENNVIGFNLTEFNKCENKFQTNYRIFDTFHFLQSYSYRPQSKLLEKSFFSLRKGYQVEKNDTGPQVL